VLNKHSKLLETSDETRKFKMQKVCHLNHINEQPAEIKYKVALLINCNKVHTFAIREKSET